MLTFARGWKLKFHYLDILDNRHQSVSPFLSLIEYISKLLMKQKFVKLLFSSK